jgi:hypothetical protein
LKGFVLKRLIKLPYPTGTKNHENETALSIHFQFNILGSEATSLSPAGGGGIGRSMLDVHFHIKFVVAAFVLSESVS